MKNRLTYILAALLSVFALTVACTDLSEIEDRIDTLESRVEALETVCKALNSNIEALEEFHAANKSISSVAEKDGVYTLTLSDGSIITLSQGSVGEAVMPFITIDAKGYWTVNGKQLTVGGQPVPATGQNGATPIFGVDANGYWTVKYSQDGAAEQVKDMNGNPVKATIGGSTSEPTDSFFSDVKIEADKVTITLKADGKSYSLPIIPDFFCAIKGAENQPVIFDPGDTKSFTVEQKNVASATLFTPNGWNASLENNLLSITAPAGVVTKASADTRQDVAILAISETGFASISKVKVQLSDKPIVVVPTAAITAGTATQNSLSFEVVLANVAEWYYMLKKSGAEAPDAEALKAASKGRETTLTLTQDADGAELTASTSYTLYVLPVNATAEGSIASQTAATTEKIYNSLYEKFMDAGAITIGGKTYNKSDYTDAQIIKVAETEFDAANNNIYFVSGAATIKSIAKNNVVIIGEDAVNKPVFTVKTSQYLTPVKGAATKLVLYNVTIDGSAWTNYIFTVNQNYDAAGAFGEFILDGCDISMPADKPFYSISNARYLDRFVMQNCTFVLKAGSAKRNIIDLATQTNVFTDVIFKNNIFYCAEGLVSNFQLVSGNTSTSATTITNVVLENNTFVNTAPNYSAMVIAKDIAAASVQNNILFIDQTLDKGGSYLFCVSKTYPTAANRNCKNNIYYNSNGKNFNMFYAAANVTNYVQAVEQTSKLDASPFSTMDYTNGIFTPKADYAAYGAQR